MHVLACMYNCLENTTHFQMYKNEIILKKVFLIEIENTHSFCCYFNILREGIMLY